MGKAPTEICIKQNNCCGIYSNLASLKYFVGWTGAKLLPIYEPVFNHQIHNFITWRKKAWSTPLPPAKQYGYTYTNIYIQGGPQKSSRFSQLITSLLIELGIWNRYHWKVYTVKFVYDVLLFFQSITCRCNTNRKPIFKVLDYTLENIGRDGYINIYI